jgi:hypothetical protein
VNIVPAKNTPACREICPTWDRNCWVRPAAALGLTARSFDMGSLTARSLMKSASRRRPPATLLSIIGEALRVRLSLRSSPLATASSADQSGGLGFLPILLRSAAFVRRQTAHINEHSPTSASSTSYIRNKECVARSSPKPWWIRRHSKQGIREQPLRERTIRHRDSLRICLR